MITNFEKFGFTPELLRGIVKMGYCDPSPVQEVAIGPMLEKRDLSVSYTHLTLPTIYSV